MSKNAHDNTAETHRKIGKQSMPHVSTKEGVLKILSANVETWVCQKQSPVWVL